MGRYALTLVSGGMDVQHKTTPRRGAERSIAAGPDGGCRATAEPRLASISHA